MVLSNHVSAEREFPCDESITYVTHGEPKYLGENLTPLLTRWMGPISIAVFTPGSDYFSSVNVRLMSKA